jgi:hypothetical protein
LRGARASTFRLTAVACGLGLVDPLARCDAIDDPRSGVCRGGLGVVAPSEQPGERVEELLGEALDELQKTNGLLHDQVERCSHLYPERVLRLALVLSRRTLRVLAAGGRARRLPALTGGDGVQPAGDVIDLTDCTIHRDLENLVTGRRQQLPPGCPHRLRACASSSARDGVGRAAREGGVRGH